jgi:hypothetical protein
MVSSRQRQKRQNLDAYFLDANLVMYAAGKPHPLRDACREALQAALDRRVSLITNSEVLQEILYRYFAIQKPEMARAVYSSTTRLCDEVIPVSEMHTARALELLLAYSRLSPRDAIHIATMEGRGIQRILSTDHDFDAIDRIERVDPADFAA